jgi:hypothetical protein
MLPHRLAHFYPEFRQPEEKFTGGIGQPPANHYPGRRYRLKVKMPARRRLNRQHLKHSPVILRHAFLALLGPQSALFCSLVKWLMRTVSQKNISMRTICHHIPRKACLHSCRTWNHPVQRTACLHSCRTWNHHN